MKICFNLILILGLFLSCEFKREVEQISPHPPSGEIAAVIESDTIYISEVDNLILPQLTNILFQIYNTRKVAVDQILESRVLKKEMEKYSLNKEEYKNKYIYGSINQKVREKYIKLFDFNNGVPVKNNYFEKHDFKSQEGQELVEAYIKEYFYKDFIDSLKQVYNCEFLVSQPQNYTLQDRDQEILNYSYPVTEKGSKNNIVLITNPNCKECKSFFSFFQDSLVAKLKNRSTISLVLLSDHVSNEVKILEAAKIQGKLMEAYSFLNKKQDLKQITPTYISEILANVPLDSIKLISDIQNKRIHKRTEEQFNSIIELGFVQTPTLIVNNKVVENIYSEEEIKSMLF